jgi:hypothetical protein
MIIGNGAKLPLSGMRPVFRAGRSTDNHDYSRHETSAGMSEAKWLTGRLRILGSAKSAQSMRLAKSKRTASSCGFGDASSISLRFPLVIGWTAYFKLHSLKK